MREALTQLNNDGKSYYWVRLPDGLNLVHPNPKNIGTIAIGETLDGKPDAQAYREGLAKDRIALVTMKTKHPKTGEMAAKILRGGNPADFPIENRVPERLIVNKVALNGLRDPWQIPDDVIAHADALIDEGGFHEKAAARPAATDHSLSKQ